MTITPIETRYAGCRFRSRLEARWAVFFDEVGIRWEYEPQGFVINDRPYLPDFLLTDCGTWVEVKGDPAHLDIDLMVAAAQQLPKRRGAGPRLLILGPIPDPPEDGDLAWVGLDPVEPDDPAVLQGEMDAGTVLDDWHGFGLFHKNKRPWILYNTSCGTPYTCGEPAEEWLIPAVDTSEQGVPEAYRAARSARFEHGEAG